MRRFTISLDDGDRLVSGIEVERETIEQAVRDHLDGAARVALGGLGARPGRRTAQMEVEDRETGEWHMCLVTVSLSVFTGQRRRH